MQFISTKEEYLVTRGEHGTYHFVLDISGWGDEAGYTWQGEAALSELDSRDWDWLECDDDECQEYFEVVFLPSGEELEEELEKLNERDEDGDDEYE